MASNKSGFDFSTLTGAGGANKSGQTVAEVLEIVPADVVAAYKSLQGLATAVWRKSGKTLSVRVIDGEPHMVRLTEATAKDEAPAAEPAA
jgi:hypothetical protein